MAAPDRDAVWQSLNIAFYALAQQLEAAGVLDQDKLADEICRFDPGDREVLRANLQGIAVTLRNRPFGPHTFRLEVIPGGKD
jgi:hypothetical protein